MNDYGREEMEDAFVRIRDAASNSGQVEDIPEVLKPLLRTPILYADKCVVTFDRLNGPVQLSFGLENPMGGYIPVARIALLPREAELLGNILQQFFPPPAGTLNKETTD